jgi:hypothetical protein
VRADQFVIMAGDGTEDHQGKAAHVAWISRGDHGAEGFKDGLCDFVVLVAGGREEELSGGENGVFGDGWELRWVSEGLV